MKVSILPVIVVCGVLALSGCAGGQVDPGIQAVVSQIEAGVAKTCQFLPEEQSIEAIITANDPALQLPQQIINAICASVTAVKAGNRSFTINGFPVIIVNGKPFVVHGTDSK